MNPEIIVDTDKNANLTHEIETLRQQKAALEARSQRAEAALESMALRNRLLGDSAPLGMFTVDRNIAVTGMNRKMRAWFDWKEIIGDVPVDLAEGLPATSAGLLADIRTCMEKARPLVVAYPLDAQDGQRLFLRYHLSPIPGGYGVGGGVMAIVEDYSELERTQKALRDSERRYRQLFQSAPFALIEWDVSQLKSHLENLRESGVTHLSQYLAANPDEVHHCWSLIRTKNYNSAFLDLMGVTGGMAPDAAFLPTDADGFLEMARGVILVAAEGHAAFEREETLVTTSGETKVVLGKALVVSGHEKTLERVAIAMVDITLRKKAEAALRESERRFREQALRDGITGLYNQRHLYAALTDWIDCAKRSDESVSLIFIDLDRFKTVVDTHGHLNGSRVIRDVARTIDDCIEAPAFAVAYAGDEFVVVLPGMSTDMAMEKADTIRGRVRETPILLDHGVEVRLTASFGVATFPRHAADLRELIAAADSALFDVKETGRDAIGVAPSENR